MPLELDPFGFVMGHCQGLAELGLSSLHHPGGYPEAGADRWEGVKAAKSWIWEWVFDGADGPSAARLFCSHSAAGCIALKGRKIRFAMYLGPGMCCQGGGGGTLSASIAAPGRMSSFGIALWLSIPSLTLVRGRVRAAKRGGIARAGGISAGINPAALYQILPPCLHLLRQPSWAQLVLSSPLSLRLDASQWISMSHSNAEKLMIKKEFFLCIIPHLRLLSTPSLQAQAAQPQPWGLVMLRCWVMQQPCPWLTKGMGHQRSLFGPVQGWHAPSQQLLMAELPWTIQPQHLQHRTLIKSTLR